MLSLGLTAPEDNQVELRKSTCFGYLVKVGGVVARPLLLYVACGCETLLFQGVTKCGESVGLFWTSANTFWPILRMQRWGQRCLLYVFREAICFLL